MTPDTNDICVFAEKRGSIKGKEIYCNPIYPYYRSLIKKYQKSPYASGIMNDHIEVNPKTDCAMLTDKSLVSFVPMSNVQEKNNVVSYDSVFYSKVKKGFTIFQRGDLIWAKITPCMQNGKSCVVSDMPTEIGFGSTEFHVIRKRTNDVYMPFIWAIFANDNVLKAAQATFSGTAGQQRVSASFIENFPAVLPQFENQIEMVAELENKLLLMKLKNEEATKRLNSFQDKIIKKYSLLGSPGGKIYKAIHYKDLDGVIDAKRYMATRKTDSKQLSDICEIIQEKTNAVKYINEVVDWIRIDDLPNSPMDIDTVRTIAASEMDGSFFEVRKGDILVARLGPTILNQKIVMVRDTERTTLASAEFLVLRCKEGYNPEAVMAVLKTQYYRDLMYSHSRGSTPSRYRLNREDALKLPFPDIKSSQRDIADEAFKVREEVVQLRNEAAKEWEDAKARFEKELLG